MVFQPLQAEHCPIHFAYWVPQFWQKKAVFVLAMIPPGEQGSKDIVSRRKNKDLPGTFPEIRGLVGTVA
jgi:hypothetical protein